MTNPKRSSPGPRISVRMLLLMTIAAGVGAWAFPIAGRYLWQDQARRDRSLAEIAQAWREAERLLAIGERPQEELNVIALSLHWFFESGGKPAELDAALGPPTSPEDFAAANLRLGRPAGTTGTTTGFELRGEVGGRPVATEEWRLWVREAGEPLTGLHCVVIGVFLEGRAYATCSEGRKVTASPPGGISSTGYGGGRTSGRVNNPLSQASGAQQSLVGVLGAVLGCLLVWAISALRARRRGTREGSAS